MKKITHTLLALAVIGSVYTVNVTSPNNIPTNLLSMASAAVQDNAQRITADGYGVAPAGLPMGQAKAMARRAAVLDAQRNLVGEIQGTQIDSETTVEMAMVKSDIIKSKISGLIKGAHVIAESIEPDGSYKVTMSVPAYGVGSLAEVAYGALQSEGKISNNPEPPAKPEPAFAKTYTPQSSSTYSGLIINAQGYELVSTYSPRICDTNGRVIYGAKNVNASYAISNGVVEYTTGAAMAAAANAGNSRAGANPLIIKAVGTTAKLVNKCDVVVSVEDGNKILMENTRSSFLSQYAVVFQR